VQFDSSLSGDAQAERFFQFSSAGDRDMFASLCQSIRYAAVAVTVVAWSVGGATPSAFGQQAAHGGHQPSEDARQQKGDRESNAPAPHGGRMTTLKSLSVEVVCQPREIRVYLYDPLPTPADVKNVKGEVVLQRRSGKAESPVALRFVAAATEREQSYLAAAVDLSGVKDGDVTATIKLENVLGADPATVKFSQPVILAKPRLEVVVAPLDDSDKPLIAQQKVCPVTGAALDSMGGPIKVLVGQQPLYLCCEGCLGKVKKDPEKYLQKAKGGKQNENR
jgi:hypothetical protein